MNQHTALARYLLLFFLLGSVGQARAELPIQYSSYSQLTVTVDLSKKMVLPLEPLVLTVTVMNRTSHPINGWYCLHAHCSGHFELFMNTPGQPPKKLDRLSWDSADILVGLPSLIPPGERHQERWVLDVDLEKYFMEPGPYQLHAVVYSEDGKGQAVSSLVPFHVQEPLGVDKLAFAYIRDQVPTQPSRFWLGTGKPDLLLLYPDTMYALHVGYRLGQWMKRRGEWKAAVEYLTPVAEHQDFPLADEALNILERFYSKNLPEKARVYQQMLNARFPQSRWADQE